MGARFVEGCVLIIVIVAKIDALQAEYSAFETVHETDGLIDTARELGIAYVAYSPLGHGWLVDNFPYNSPEDFAPDDFRRTCTFPPRSPLQKVPAQNDVTHFCLRDGSVTDLSPLP